MINQLIRLKYYYIQGFLCFGFGYCEEMTTIISTKYVKVTKKKLY